VAVRLRRPQLLVDPVGCDVYDIRIFLGSSMSSSAGNGDAPAQKSAAASSMPSAATTSNGSPPAAMMTTKTPPAGSEAPEAASSSNDVDDDGNDILSVTADHHRARVFFATAKIAGPKSLAIALRVRKLLGIEADDYDEDDEDVVFGESADNNPPAKTSLSSLLAGALVTRILVLLVRKHHGDDSDNNNKNTDADTTKKDSGSVDILSDLVSAVQQWYALGLALEGRTDEPHVSILKVARLVDERLQNLSDDEVSELNSIITGAPPSTSAAVASTSSGGRDQDGKGSVQQWWDLVRLTLRDFIYNLNTLAYTRCDFEKLWVVVESKLSLDGQQSKVKEIWSLMPALTDPPTGPAAGAKACRSVPLPESSDDADMDLPSRVKLAAWRLACYRSYGIMNATTSSDDKQKENLNGTTISIPTRRQRLLASCGSLAFLVALAQRDRAGEPDRKRRRTEDDSSPPLDQLARTANWELSHPSTANPVLSSFWRDVPRPTDRNDNSNNESADERKLIDVDELRLELAALSTAVGSETANSQSLMDEVAKKRNLRPPAAVIRGGTSSLSTNEDNKVWLPDLLAQYVYYLPRTANWLFHTHTRNTSFLDEDALVRRDAHFLSIIFGKATSDVDTCRNQIEQEINQALRSCVPTSTGKFRLMADASGKLRLTDHMQMNEWAVSLMALDLVKPSHQLYQHLYNRNNVVDWQGIVNNTLLHLLQENLSDKHTRVAAVSIGITEGEVNVVGDETSDKKLCKAVVALYYHSLEAILVCESARPNNPNDALTSVSKTAQMVSDVAFHRSLLACCVICVTKALGVTHKLKPRTHLSGGGGIALQPMYSVLRICRCNPYDFLKVSGSFCHCLTADTARGKLGSPLVFALPRLLVKEIRRAEGQVLESLLWARDLPFLDPDTDGLLLFERIENRTALAGEPIEGCWWPPQLLYIDDEDVADAGSASYDTTNSPTPSDPDYTEYRYISFLLRKLLHSVDLRMRALCELLEAPALVAKRALATFCYLLRHHVDNIYDRHLDPIILCCVYGAGRTIKCPSEITFARTFHAYVHLRGPELGDTTAQQIVRNIRLDSKKRYSKAPIGDVIQFYNLVFLPNMKDYLMKFSSVAPSAPPKPIESGTAPQSEKDENELTIRVKIVSPDRMKRLSEQSPTVKVAATGASSSSSSAVAVTPQAVIRFGDAKQSDVVPPRRNGTTAAAAPTTVNGEPQ